MSDQKIELTVFRVKRGRTLTKVISLHEGELVKDSSGCAMSRGVSETKSVHSLEQFNRALDGLQPNEALAYGIARQPKNKIVSAKDLPQHPDAITRSKGNFEYPKHAIMMLDYDPDPGQPVLSRDELYQALINAMPELESADMLWRPSASSCIYNGDEEVIGVSGQRLYLAVDNGAMIPRIGETLNKRLWLAGHGRVMISRSGALLPRTLVDATVWQGERLDFAAGAVCRAPLERRPVPGHIYKGYGPIFPTELLEKLTKREEADVTRRIDAEKAAAKPEQKIIIDRYVNEEIAKAKAGGASEEDLRKLRDNLHLATENLFLTSDFILHLDNYGDVNVEHILANKQKYHGETLADPLEPEYGGGRGKAKLFLSGTTPIVRSFAHGGRKYNLRVQSTRLEVREGALAEVVAQTTALLAKEPDLFCTDAGVVIINRDIYGLPKIELMNPETTTIRAAANIRYYRVTEDKNGNIKERDVDPPARVMQIIAKRKDRTAFRNLNGIITAPTMTLDGGLVSEPGYHKDAGLLLMTDEPPPDVPMDPTKEEVAQAQKTLLGPFEHFDFEAEIDKAVFISALLTAAVRRALPTAPGYIFSATTAGSGKTKLAQCVDIIAGGVGGTTSLPNDSEELRKTLTGNLLAGKPSMVFDNITGHLRSDLLCNVLSSPVYEDRILGTKDRVKLSTRGMFLFTGNNLDPAGDLSRRTLKVHIDTNCENPWQRAFEFDPVTRVRNERMVLIAAALTLLRGYVSIGMPRLVNSHTGSFEEWSRLVRQTVIWLGFEDPETVMHANFEMDPETEALSRVLEGWEGLFGESFVENDTLRKALFDDFSDEGNRLLEAFEEAMSGGKLSARGIGRWLSYRKGRILNGRRLTPGKAAGARGWRLQRLQ